MNSQKIFCLGMHKTGTTSLLQAFLQLGIRTCDGLAGAPQGERSSFARADSQISYLDGLLSQYQAFEDVPWPLFYQELYERYPDSYFILTTRDLKRWIRSCIAHFGAESDPVHEWIYGIGCGAPLGNEDEWMNKFIAHNQAVLDFFAAKPQSQFLHIAIDNGEESRDVSERLRQFLGYPPGLNVWANANSSSRAARNPLFRVVVPGLRRLKYLMFGKKSISVFGIQLTRDCSSLMEPSERPDR